LSKVHKKFKIKGKIEKMATIQDIETLRKGDYIEASELYSKVLAINIQKKQLTLTEPFEKGFKPRSRWVSKYTENIAAIDLPHWNIIRADSKGARGIEGKLSFKHILVMRK